MEKYLEGYPNEAYCLVQTESGFEVFYAERGNG